MALPARAVIGILSDNLRLRGSVLPIPAHRVTGWARGLDLPRGGPTVLYTGQMYQLIPYIEALVRLEHRLGGTPLARFAGLGRLVNRMVDVSGAVTHPPAAECAQYDQVLRNVARLLQVAGVEFGCMFEDDLYSGALAHDLGLDEAVAGHARRVAAAFRKHGVRTAITVDPHTTHMLRSVYPRLVSGFDVEVKSYLEVLAGRSPQPVERLAGEVAIHDSCVYARYEDVVREPRALLAAAGLTVREPLHAGRATWCCGGPAEALYPQKAAAVAAERVAQLRAAGPTCVTMCPICLVNLRKAAGGALDVHDISQDLARAFAASDPRALW